MVIVGLILGAVALASSWWLVRSSPSRMQAGFLIAAAVVLFVLPWLAPRDPDLVIGRCVLTLACCAVLTPKLLDAFIAPGSWAAGRRFRDWLAYLLNPYVLVYRAHLEDPAGSKGESLTFLVGGAARIVAGAAVLVWAFQEDFAGRSFWTEHTIKAIGAYLAAFDGPFVLATGLLRLSGGRAMEFSRVPILAYSPADFWRRYNRDAGRFLAMDVMLPLVGKRSIVAGTAVVFLINGALHEYLLWVMAGRLAGYQLAFFGVQGVATIATQRWRPRGAARVAGWVVTLLFNLITSVLFFASVDLFVDWYDAQVPLWW